MIADFNEEALNGTVDMLKSQGVQALGVKVNVAVEEDIQRMINDTVTTFGSV